MRESQLNCSTCGRFVRHGDAVNVMIDDDTYALDENGDHLIECPKCQRERGRKLQTATA